MPLLSKYSPQKNVIQNERTKNGEENRKEGQNKEKNIQLSSKQFKNFPIFACGPRVDKRV
jgi:hypothetical protein